MRGKRPTSKPSFSHSPWFHRHGSRMSTRPDNATCVGSVANSPVSRAVMTVFAKPNALARRYASGSCSLSQARLVAAHVPGTSTFPMIAS